MEQSIIYDLLSNKLLIKWREKIEKDESDTWFFTNVQETFNELEKSLDEQEKALLKTYSLAIENKLDYLYCNLKIKVLNYGIKIGMELMKSFVETEE